MILMLAGLQGIAHASFFLPVARTAASLLNLFLTLLSMRRTSRSKADEQNWILDVPERTKQGLKDLRELVDDAKKIQVIIYGNPDPDALASGWALKFLLETDERPVAITYTGTVGRPENASMIRHLGIPVQPAEEKADNDKVLVALVDAQPQFFRDFQLPRCDIVIDHHPVYLEQKISFVDIRPDYAAASSIMTEYLRAANIKLTRRLASALYYGIKVDSRRFISDLHPCDIEALRWLSAKADPDIVSRIEFSQFSREALDYFSIALVRRRLVRGVMFTHVGPVPVSDVCVQVADFLIRVETVEWALVTGVVGDTLVIVFRNDGLHKDAGHVARAAFDRYGSAGGHKTMGRAEVQRSSLPGGLLLTDNKGIERFVLSSLAEVDSIFGSVLRSIGSRR
jgi:nanoRNase/pAp phosphatase (c-di-AMP/oligoRNAs hydrolase)